jgi:hypothetical protein
MKRSRRQAGYLCAMLALLFCAMAASAAQTSKPITYKGLLNSLKTHGLTNAELTKIIKTRGVDFELTADKESELKTAGADADLLAAVRANLHTAGTTAPANTGTQTATSPPATAPASPPATQPVTQPPTEKEKPATPATASNIASIRDVKKLFIEKMPNDLDEYIKAEISRQMPGRILVVLRVEDADAIMKGTATERKGSVTITDVRGTADLWVGEAGDKGLYLTKVHGGEKKVAERLVSGLKKAMF